MVVAADGEPIGSVCGGCVEGAVYELAQEVMASGEPVLQRYGVSDDDAFAVGLTCGGIIDIFVEPVDASTFPELPDVVASIRAHEPVAVATVVDGPGNVGAHLVVWPDRAAGALGTERLDEAVADDVRGMLDHGANRLLRIGPDGERRQDELSVFVQSFAPPPRMLVFGAIDFAAAVARVGKFLGYHVTVCDARGVFATRKRFPEADEVVVEWPHRYLATQQVDARTVICVLTHDPKFDVPLLEVALQTDAAYIGAMGSRRTHDDRLARLREEGVTEEALARLRRRSGSTSAPARRRRPRCRSPPRSWRTAGAAPAPRLRPITRTAPSTGDGRRGAGAGRRGGPAVWARPRRWSRSAASGWSTGRCGLRHGGCEPVVVVLGAAPRRGAGGAGRRQRRTGRPAWARPCASGWPASARSSDRRRRDARRQAGSHRLRRRPAGRGVRRGRRRGRGDVRRTTAHPVLLTGPHWPEVAEMAVGDVGARAFLRAHPHLVRHVECGDVGTPDDIDTPEDLSRFTT